MENYRALIHAVMKRSGISLDQSLSTIALVIRALAQQLSSGETAVLKTSVAPELCQLLVEGRRAGVAGPGHNGGEMIEAVGAALDLTEAEAKARILSVLDELRAGISLWDDVQIFEIFDRVRAEVEHAPVPAEVEHAPVPAAVA